MSNSSKVFLVVLILMIGGGYYAFQSLNIGGSTQDAVLAEGPVEIIIPPGTPGRGVGDILEESGVIASASAFVAAATIDGRVGSMQAGTYVLDPAQSNDELLDILVLGPPRVDTYRVTIPEGLTVPQTLTRLGEAEGSPFTVDQLRTALASVALPEWVPDRPDLPEGAEAFEGMLFPNTYEFTVEETPEEVLTELVGETERVMTEVGPSTVNDLNLYDTLVLGSLVEREAKLGEERPVISSVIHNRLDIGMRLQIDATVIYGIEVATGERPDGLLTSDYQFDTPWSTYLFPGLPPTPISGVGQASIEAAANPDDTNFFFYVVEVQETGKHRFSETLDQHNQAIAEIRGN